MAEKLNLQQAAAQAIREEYEKKKKDQVVQRRMFDVLHSILRAYWHVAVQ